MPTITGTLSQSACPREDAARTAIATATATIATQRLTIIA
jgi:hypothetical protein